jgi:protein-S-isoprenylcysteine O-methyltransferase Ste14
MNPLTHKVILNFVTRFVVLAALLFVPANSVSFPRGWAFLAAYFLPQAFVVAYFLRTDPAFVERRLKMGPGAETRPRQKFVMALVILLSFISVIIAGFDHRFGRSQVSLLVSIVGCIGIVIGIGFQFRVFMENSFASATIELAADQKVIATGPYAFIRHPMYFGSLLTDCCIPLALGSWWALLPVMIKFVVIVVRLLDEEDFLRANLSGYADYCQKVPRRLIPAIW